MKYLNTIKGLAMALSVLLFSTIANADILISDFDDGTTQGWVTANPLNPGSGFNGILTVQNLGGNPGGFLQATDNVSGGGSLAVLAPLPFFGDLSQLGFIRWDVLLPTNSTLSTSALIEGIDGTLFRSNNNLNPLTPIGSWFTKTASFTSANSWTRIPGSGSASFQTVIANTVALYIELDTTQQLGVEAGIDNVRIQSSTPPPPPRLRVTVHCLGSFPGFNGTDLICLANAFGGTGNYTYGWNFSADDGNIFPNQNQATINGCLGDATIGVIVNDGNTTASSSFNTDCGDGNPFGF